MIESSILNSDGQFSQLMFEQREAVEALIEELPKFRLKAVPTDCSECPICLEEFHVGNEVIDISCLTIYTKEVWKSCGCKKTVVNV